MPAPSMMLRTTKRVIALSFGVQRPQFVHRMGETWPRPCLDLPLGVLVVLM